MPRSRVQHTEPPQTGAVQDRRRIEALLEHLILVFRGMRGRPEPAAQTGSFAATLPRYEFKHKSIFPSLQDAHSDTPLPPLRARAELRTILDDLAFAFGGSASGVAGVLATVRDGVSLPAPSSEHVTTLKALPAYAAADQPNAEILARLRAALTAYLAANEDRATILAMVSTER